MKSLCTRNLEAPPPHTQTHTLPLVVQASSGYVDWGQMAEGSSSFSHSWPLPPGCQQHSSLLIPHCLLTRPSQCLNHLKLGFRRHFSWAQGFTSRLALWRVGCKEGTALPPPRVLSRTGSRPPPLPSASPASTTGRHSFVLCRCPLKNAPPSSVPQHWIHIEAPMVLAFQMDRTGKDESEIFFFFFYKPLKERAWSFLTPAEKESQHTSVRKSWLTGNVEESTALTVLVLGHRKTDAVSQYIILI